MALHQGLSLGSAVFCVAHECATFLRLSATSYGTVVLSYARGYACALRTTAQSLCAHGPRTLRMAHDATFLTPVPLPRPPYRFISDGPAPLYPSVRMTLYRHQNIAV